MLRQGIDDPEKRARFGAVYTILGGVSAPITFMVIRLFRTIHPVIIGAANANQEKMSMTGDMKFAFFFALFAFFAAVASPRRSSVRFSAPMLLAEAIGGAKIDSYVLGWGVVLSLLTLSALGTNLATLIRGQRAQKRDVTITDQFVTHAVCDASHREIINRLTRNESSLASAWETMRREDETTRSEVRKCFQDIERALGRIEGRLKGLHEDT